MSTDAPAKDTSTQLPAPDAVLFRHVPGSHSKPLICFSDEVVELFRPGESLCNYVGHHNHVPLSPRVDTIGGCDPSLMAKSSQTTPAFRPCVIP